MEGLQEKEKRIRYIEIGKRSDRLVVHRLTAIPTSSSANNFRVVAPHNSNNVSLVNSKNGLCEVVLAYRGSAAVVVEIGSFEPRTTESDTARRRFGSNDRFPLTITERFTWVAL